MEAFPPETEAEYKIAFEFFDTDRSGSIPAKKFVALMRSVGENILESQAQQYCGASGSIDLNGFLTIFREKWKRAQAYDECVNAFAFFDYEGNGTVKADILKYVLCSIGNPSDLFTEQEVDEMIRDANGGQNGDSIRYQEFVKKMLQATQ